ncbi:MAG: 2Fe-2S iron-sulfur cluster-binding protein [Planctomycetota bacterium]|jgi:2Fe-2S ferredoxin
MAKHKVTFEPRGVTVEVDIDDLPDSRHGRRGSILDVALANGVEIEHNCGGVCVCGTCHVIVEEGMEGLSEAAEDELDVIAEVPGNTLSSRLACQAVVKGDVTVRIPAPKKA